MHLQLRGLPANAFVTLDGEPASSTLTLSRSEHTYDLSVTAPGKVAWHIHYVPRADEALDVESCETANPLRRHPAAAPPKRTIPRKKHKPQSPGPLRVARLLSAAPASSSSAIFDRALDVAHDAVFLERERPGVAIDLVREAIGVRDSLGKLADHALQRRASESRGVKHSSSRVITPAARASPAR